MMQSLSTVSSAVFTKRHRGANFHRKNCSLAVPNDHIEGFEILRFANHPRQSGLNDVFKREYRGQAYWSCRLAHFGTAPETQRSMIMSQSISQPDDMGRRASSFELYNVDFVRLVFWHLVSRESGYKLLDVVFILEELLTVVVAIRDSDACVKLSELTGQ